VPANLKTSCLLEIVIFSETAAALQIPVSLVCPRPYVTTYVQSASLFWWPKTRFLLLSASCGFLYVELLLALASVVILGPESRGTHDHISLSQSRDSPNLEGQVPVFISPSHRVTQLYPQSLVSFFVASYDSQGYGGGI
jgi:hypothetical protein